ncbi:MAG TPA: energy transducer TonB [Blastocatellia bacterium]|nr:energy transducer TonB [Blastocatellia bacterium]
MRLIPRIALIAFAVLAAVQLPVSSAVAVPSAQLGQPAEQMQPVQKREPPVLAISPQQKRILSRQLDSAPEYPIKIDSAVDQASPGAPVSITKAALWAVKRQMADQPPAAPSGTLPLSLNASTNDYAVRITLLLHNDGNSRIATVGLQFANAQNGMLFVTGKGAEIAPGGNADYTIPFMLLTGDPADLEVEVIRAKFQDGAAWDAPAAPGRTSRFPSGGNHLPASSPQPDTGEIVATKVDQMPRAVNSPRPVYTEDARMNHISGLIRLRALVTKQGVVSATRVISPLPDGLTEQAIRAVHEMKFTPAMKDGNPVAFWVKVEIEFGLRT